MPIIGDEEPTAEQLRGRTTPRKGKKEREREVTIVPKGLFQQQCEKAEEQLLSRGHECGPPPPFHSRQGKPKIGPVHIIPGGPH